MTWVAKNTKISTIDRSNNESLDSQIIAMTVRPTAGSPCCEYNEKQMVWMVQNTSIPEEESRKPSVLTPVGTGGRGILTNGGRYEESPATDSIT